MKFGYTIIYVPSVSEVLAFYGQAFGFETRFVHESGDYGELETGATAIAFASHSLGEINLGRPFIKNDPSAAPFGMELAFVSEDVASAYERAIAAGARAIKAPSEKPWGQIVAYVRAIDGSLIELCSPMGD